MKIKGISAEKRIVSTVAAVLAVVITFSLFSGALAAPSLPLGTGGDIEVTPTPTPTPTPTGGGKAIPGDGKRPEGDPPGDGDGPGGGSGEGEQKPPPTPPVPPGKEPPTEPPIEIEIPEDGSDADIKPKKGKKKEYEKQAVWTISFKKAVASSSNKHLPAAFYDYYTIDFSATKQAGDTMLGAYTGSGYLVLKVDTSGAIAISEGALQSMNIAAEGPLNGIGFELVGSYAESSLDRLAPLADEDIAPLEPEDNPKPKLSGEANSSMAWASGVTENDYVFQGIHGRGRDAQPPTDLTYYIYAYPSGKAEISLYGTTAAKSYLTFWGTISKKIDWKQVK